MPDVVRGLAAAERAVAFRNFVDAIEPLGRITFPDRPYGQLIAEPPLTATDWHDYLRRSLQGFTARNGATLASEFADVEGLVEQATRLLDKVDPRPPKALVHGDYFPANVLMDDRLQVSAIIDLAPPPRGFTLAGDRLIDAACAMVFVGMIEHFSDADCALTRGLVLDRFGSPLAEAEPFYRAYFAFFLASPEYAAPPYPKLYAWSMAELAGLAEAAV
jgi:hypothetical protein